MPLLAPETLLGKLAANAGVLAHFGGVAPVRMPPRLEEALVAARSVYVASQGTRHDVLIQDDAGHPAAAFTFDRTRWSFGIRRLDLPEARAAGLEEPPVVRAVTPILVGDEITSLFPQSVRGGFGVGLVFDESSCTLFSIPGILQGAPMLFVPPPEEPSVAAAPPIPAAAAIEERRPPAAPAAPSGAPLPPAAPIRLLPDHLPLATPHAAAHRGDSFAPPFFPPPAKGGPLSPRPVAAEIQFIDISETISSRLFDTIPDADLHLVIDLTGHVERHVGEFQETGHYVLSLRRTSGSGARVAFSLSRPEVRPGQPGIPIAQISTANVRSFQDLFAPHSFFVELPDSGGEIQIGHLQFTLPSLSSPGPIAVQMVRNRHHHTEAELALQETVVRYSRELRRGSRRVILGSQKKPDVVVVSGSETVSPNHATITWDPDQPERGFTVGAIFPLGKRTPYYGCSTQKIPEPVFRRLTQESPETTLAPGDIVLVGDQCVRLPEIPGRDLGGMLRRRQLAETTGEFRNTSPSGDRPTRRRT